MNSFETKETSALSHRVQFLRKPWADLITSHSIPNLKLSEICDFLVRILSTIPGLPYMYGFGVAGTRV